MHSNNSKPCHTSFHLLAVVNRSVTMSILMLSTASPLTRALPPLFSLPLKMAASTPSIRDRHTGEVREETKLKDDRSMPYSATKGIVYIHVAPAIKMQWEGVHVFHRVEALKFRYRELTLEHLDHLRLYILNCCLWTYTLYIILIVVDDFFLTIFHLSACSWLWYDALWVDGGIPLCSVQPSWATARRRL